MNSFLKQALIISLIAIPSVSSGRMAPPVSPYKICITVNYIENFRNVKLQPGSEAGLWMRMRGSIFNGHTAINITRNNKIIKTYGYRPGPNLSIDDERDRAMPEYHDSVANYTLKSRNYCQIIEKRRLSRVDSLAQGYQRKYGKWGYFNNCIHFAKRIFKQVTGKNINSPTLTPTSLMKSVEKKYKSDGSQPGYHEIEFEVNLDPEIVCDANECPEYEYESNQ